jgi:hypothetical protein
MKFRGGPKSMRAARQRVGLSRRHAATGRAQVAATRVQHDWINDIAHVVNVRVKHHPDIVTIQLGWDRRYRWYLSSTRSR